MYAIVVYDGNPIYKQFMKMQEDAELKSVMKAYCVEAFPWATDEVIDAYVELSFKYENWIYDWAKRCREALYIIYETIKEMMQSIQNLFYGTFCTLKDSLSELATLFDDFRGYCKEKENYDDLFDDDEVYERQKYHKSYYLSNQYTAKINSNLNRQKRNFICYKRQH